MVDCCVIGGGLAGLSSAILLAQKGYETVLIEKKKYPFHKVCGEYISMESYPFLLQLGIPLEELNLPRINQLKISSPSGHFLEQEITPGGFGISRYLLDNLLYKRALEVGVSVKQNTSVADIVKEKDRYVVFTSENQIESRVCIGSYGKRSSLDASLSRQHKNEERNSKQNYIGVKYHVKADLPDNLIELHNFKDGYCGISKVEGDDYCMCYLTTAKNLKASNGSIEDMEKTILSKNPYLKRYFEEFPKTYEKPLSISNIYFKDKNVVEKGIFMSGDSAGLITPLCGNGMSMALHASAILSEVLPDYLEGKISQTEATELYTRRWRKEFNTRLKAGRTFQRLFGNPGITDFVIKGLSKNPKFTQRLVNLTNGRTFTVNI